MDILIYESMCLGFVIGFLSLYYYIPYVLIAFLFIHLIGTVYSERKSGKLGEIFPPTFLRRAPVKVPETSKPIPQEYRYNYHLKPSNDFRLQQVRTSSWKFSSFVLLIILVIINSSARNFQPSRHDLFTQCSTTKFCIVE